jgi:hypothetical protein
MNSLVKYISLIQQYLVSASDNCRLKILPFMGKNFSLIEKEKSSPLPHTAFFPT